MISPLLAATLSALFSLAGWKARSLTLPGALAAFAVGLAVLAGTGWPGGAALAVFFLSSSTVSRLTESRQSHRLDPTGNLAITFRPGGVRSLASEAAEEVVP